MLNKPAPHAVQIELETAAGSVDVVYEPAGQPEQPSSMPKAGLVLKEPAGHMEQPELREPDASGRMNELHELVLK